MKTLGYYNGRYDEIDNMTIPMNDRVCWFGDGVYDAGPCRNYHIFALDEHVDRFFNNAGLLKIQMPCTKEELKALLNDLVRKMDTGSLFVYYQVTRGTAVRSHEFPVNCPANLGMVTSPGFPEKPPSQSLDYVKTPESAGADREDQADNRGGHAFLPL